MIFDTSYLSNFIKHLKTKLMNEEQKKEEGFFDKLKDTFNELKDKAEETWEKVEDKAEEAWDKVEDKAEEVWASAKDKASELKDAVAAKVDDLTGKKDEPNKTA